MLSEALLQRLFPRAQAADLAAFVMGEPLLKSAGILDNTVRAAVFLAQCGHESQGLTRRKENLVYSTPERLMAVWPSRFPTRASALPYVRRPELLAEHVYGGRADLGNVQEGDGWRFVARGYIGVTGRANYRWIGQEMGVDLEETPELLEQPAHALSAAVAYWRKRNLNARCDLKDPVYSSTQRINGGLTGLNDRRALYALAKVFLDAEVERQRQAGVRHA